jgi:hypothetical protein
MGSQEKRRSKLDLSGFLLLTIVITLLLAGIISAAKQNVQEAKKKSQSTACTQISGPDPYRIIENQKVIIGILQGQNSRLREIIRESNIQIADSKK